MSADIHIGRIQGRGLKGLLPLKANTEVLTEAELNHHVHIVGATGYGKTVLLSKLLKSKIRNREGFIFIDLKNDFEFIQELKREIEQVNRQSDYQYFSLSKSTESVAYNFLKSGDATELRDRIISGFNWSEEYYKNQSMSFLLKLLTAFVELREKGDFKFSIHEILRAAGSSDYLREIYRQYSKEESLGRKLLRELVTSIEEGDLFKSLQGLRTQLESLIHSSFGESLRESEGGIDIFESCRDGNIIIVSLDSRRYPESSKAIGRFLIQDLKSTSARIDAEIPREQRKPFAVIIDEFADLAQEDFIGFLDRARSSKMSIVVAHQELCDLQRISPEFAGRLMGNTSTVYAFLQKRPESAETLAKMIGTKSVWKETHQVERKWFFEIRTGAKSLREVEEFIVHPNVIKSQRVGECVVIKKYPTSTARILRVNY